MRRLFVLTSQPPLPSWGTSMTLWRHLVERNSFDIMVATNSNLIDQYDVPYDPIRLKPPKVWKRLCHSRLSPWCNGFQNLYGSRLLGPNFINRVSKFSPDAVLTVAGSWDYTALTAKRVSNQLGIPLISSFNDWFDYGSFLSHESFRPKVEARFREFYRQSDLSLCTSDGMMEALGTHSNSLILYPTGAKREEQDKYQPIQHDSDRPLRVLFAGSLGDWYGPMMESLVTECQKQSLPVEFRIYGTLQTWSSSFDDWAKINGVYLGRIPFEELREKSKWADLLILPMGFDKSCSHIEKTSFKTKFLDYLAFRRPIFIWGPEYCSAVRIAREFDSAECQTSESVSDCAVSLGEMAKAPERRRILLSNADEMYEDRFHPDIIHQHLVDRFDATVEAL